MEDMGGYLALVREAESTAGTKDDGLFETVPAIVERDLLPELPPEVIGGIIRRGGKLLVAGASKSGKSYLMIELAVAVATGSEWLGSPCAQGRVLYVNLEVQMPQFMHRVQRVCEKMGVDAADVPRNLMIANQRGKQGRRALAEIERELDAFMGERREVGRKAFVDHAGKDPRTVKKYLEQSKLF